MSVIVKGMEMPKSCDDCRFDNNVYCLAYPQSAEIIYDIADGIPKFCPLVEVPTPHGRLIDADELMKDGWRLYKEVIRMGGYAIHEKPLNYPDIPTIIGSSGK